jgi:hypothetical protein
MTATASAGGGRPPASSPAEATEMGAARPESRADIMAWAMTDRHMFALQSKRIAVITRFNHAK